ncbi:ribulose-phosphate 3-epimerase [Phaeodactylibacter xiamenensis]|jgi:ribulose-phosphate 3-epimerase|uniref:Ribulose-phosphate 3-epimerase n=1 Tax=Phaeodactylibacter xiamenensis TaxID=1524460 RepID=A0A098S6V4_9BACT|nr:ribulose-phosphate 3-epimerase [Phaeodactylibacter xiamenensis]KGE87383.1 ribulose-phosphate 3-epimerase [Phaeodactylibacter xiamenensis]MCR9052814.1 ribulose-phosphate 3-epimerase [bacterium]
MNHIIAPSLLAADFTRLADEIQMVNDSQADWLHLDVMDGRFVPNITFGMLLIDAAKQLCTKPLDVHLMIVEPEKYVEQFREAGADTITVHLEASPHLHRTLQQIKATGAKAGVAINPHTPASSLEDIIELADLVCVMSVNPGFGGQKFIYNTIPKIRRIKDLITVRNTETLIEVDGGVGLHNAEKILQAGADVLVAGSSVFKADDPADAVARLKDIGGEIQRFA